MLYHRKGLTRVRIYCRIRETGAQNAHIGEKGPFVYPILLKDGTNVGYVQACPIAAGWEAGYHVAKPYTGNGYASEALEAFLPIILDRLGIDKIYGIVLEENTASIKVLEKCNFNLAYAGIGRYQGVERPIRRYLFRR